MNKIRTYNKNIDFHEKFTNILSIGINYSKLEAYRPCQALILIPIIAPHIPKYKNNF